MIKRFPVSLLLAISTSSALAGCQIDVEDPTNAQPVIHLNGESTMSLALNQAYIEPGYQALDAEDGDLTANILSNSAAVNTQTAGSYEITYNVMDSGNFSAKPAKRIVVVVTDAESGAPAEEPAQSVTSTVPAISSFKLVAVTPEKQVIEVSEIISGTTLDLSLMPTHLLNIEAVSTDASKTGSVHFALEGPVSLDRYENNAIYTLQVEPAQLNTENNELPIGDYSLSVTPYSAPDMGGAKGSTHTVTFSVRDHQLEVSSVPKLLAADFVVVNEATGDLNTFDRITEGFELDLSQVPSALINVLAISEDAINTGSVHFSLNGPTTIDRYENSAGYTMAAEPASIDITKDGLKNGDYSLIITPYADPDMGGEAGIPLLVNFSVTGTVSLSNSSEPTTGVASPDGTVTLKASPDNYTFNEGGDQQPGMTTAVSANDLFDDTSAQFSVVSLPKHGTVKMFDLGYFEYTPASGYSGGDSFTYQVSQNGTSSTATASITVYDPQTNTGFTAISPSADSKLIYVSSSLGNDSNTCLAASAPCASISAALEKMRRGYPDHVYLKRGDEWRGQNLNGVTSGRSAKEPAVIAYYGSGPRPLIETSVSTAKFVKGDLSHVSFIGLHTSAYKLDPQHPEFTGSKSDKANISFLGAHKNILFEDNIFDHVEIVVQDWNGRPADFSFRRNVFTGAYVDSSSYDRNSRPSNMFVKGVDGLLLEENVFDYGGWHPTTKGAAANMFNHNIYLQAGSDGNRTVVRGNIIVRGSSHGIQMRSGGIADNNFFAKNAVSLLIGYSEVPLVKDVNACAINNVITEGHSMVKGVEACSGVNLCTPAVWGLHFHINGAGNYQASHNIVHSLAKEDTGWKSKFGKLQLRATPGLENLLVKSSDNHSWRWESAKQGGDQGYPAPSRTLGSYYTHLVAQGHLDTATSGATEFDKFMNLAKSRNVGEWNELLSATAINDYVRAGYNIQAKGQCE